MWGRGGEQKNIYKISKNNNVKQKKPSDIKLENKISLTCTGIPEIVAAYQNCIRQVQLYGPTNVSPIINHVIRFAETAAKENTASVCTMQCQWSLSNLS